MIILVDAHKPFDLIQHPYVKKKINKINIEETNLNTTKAFCEKSTDNIIFNGEKLKVFSLRSGKNVYFYHFYST